MNMSQDANIFTNINQNESSIGKVDQNILNYSQANQNEIFPGVNRVRY